ncbi:MAG: hypothetical protein L3J75_12415 [Methylococcaceae bacterium]|nr:hypothetical protein [Methylococcaceae bacterium]
MHFLLEPNVGANNLKFSVQRNTIRNLIETKPLTKINEPENDFYEKEGLILGYDENDELEYIEIIRPSTAEFQKINFFSINLSSCVNEMKKSGFVAPFDDGGYNFESIGLTFYCPQDILESVSLYRSGYFDDL